MSQEDLVSIDSALSFSHVLTGLIMFLFFLLVVSCGPLLSVWMFINSMQLIVHIPLIAIKLPGNAHYFLLDHLNLFNLHLFSNSLS